MPDRCTINGLLAATIRRYPQRPALGMAFASPLTYAALGESIRLVTAALVSRGLLRGDKVAILAENSCHWGVVYLAITGCGAVVVPILPDFPEADIHHILTETDTKFVFVGHRQIDKVLDCNRHQLRGIFSLDDKDPEHRDSTATYSDLLHEGASLPLDAIAVAEATPLHANDTAAIIYTSGTSGHAKAAMLSHANITANVHSAQAVIVIPPGATFLSILPLSHAYEFTMGFVLPLSRGARVVYADRAPTPTVLERICRHERPNAMCVVPMVIDKIYKKKVLPAIQEKVWLRQMAKFSWSRKLLMKKIGATLLDFFGGELVVMAIGGAALNHETETFLREAGFPYMTGYGLTETSPLLAAGALADPSVALGSVGPPVPGVEIVISDADPHTGIGQIMARGPNIMQGYYRNLELTEETIDPQGWLATGDLGFFDDSGNLHIKGRSKSVIILSHGENIYPEAIEEKINAFAQVVESLVLANEDRLLALVYLDYDQVDRQAKTQEEQRYAIEQLLAKIKMEVNQDLPPYAKLHKVAERVEPFIKTATQKIKRYLYQ
ncbi:MAG: AMP-binding protein [Desulfobulbaceae bacterium]|nr:AMP-binding protein [Desulfobulbaceae bacterium]